MRRLPLHEMYLLAILLIMFIPLLYLLPVTNRRGVGGYFVIFLFWVFIYCIILVLRR